MDIKFLNPLKAKDIYKMNIMIIRPQFESGGATKSIIYLANGLFNNGHKIILVSNGGDWLPKFDERIRWYKVPLFPSNLKNFTYSFFRIIKIIKIENIEIINSHHRFSTLLCNFIRMFINIPIVSTVHEIKNNYSLFTKFIFSKFNIVFSEAVKSNLIINYNVKSERIKKIQISIDNLHNNSAITKDYKNKLNINNNHQIISFIGRLSPEKGCFVFLEAIKEIIKKNYVGNFLFIGDGDLRNELEAKSQEYNLKRYVNFLGWQEDIAQYISLSDFLVLPSFSEGLGLVIIEGWGLKKPTIASNVGGISDLINDGENGILVPVNDEKALAEAIIDLINNPKKKNLLGENGYKLFSSTYNQNHQISETEKYFFWVISTKDKFFN